MLGLGLLISPWPKWKPFWVFCPMPYELRVFPVYLVGHFPALNECWALFLVIFLDGIFLQPWVVSPHTCSNEFFAKCLRVTLLHISSILFLYSSLLFGTLFDKLCRDRSLSVITFWNCRCCGWPNQWNRFNSFILWNKKSLRIRKILWSNFETKWKVEIVTTLIIQRKTLTCIETWSAVMMQSLLRTQISGTHFKDSDSVDVRPHLERKCSTESLSQFRR